jgi:hypothetical protein
VPARGGIRNAHRVRGSNLTCSHLLCRQLGKPHASRRGGIPTVRKGRVQGEGEVGGSEGRPVTGRIGLSQGRDTQPERVPTSDWSWRERNSAAPEALGKLDGEIAH